jgi:hypothetical protein
LNADPLCLYRGPMFERFKRKKAPAEPASDEPLIPVPVPALVALLLNLERKKGAPLTEAEVNDVRDKCACIMMPVSVVQKMASLAATMTSIRKPLGSNGRSCGSN